MSQSNAEHLTEQVKVTTKLKALITRLGADAASLHAHRQDTANGRVSLMHQILFEIEETILPRQLTLHFDQTIVATFRVSHRRLLSLDFAVDADQAKQPQRSEHRSAAQVYAQRLLHLSAMHQDASFRITRQICETGLETESCSVAQLVDSLKMQQQESRLKGFLTKVSANVDAWVLQAEGDNQHSCHGPAALTGQLTELANIDQTAKQKRGQALKMPEKAPSYLVLSMSGETNVILAWDRSETLLIALPTQHLTSFNTAWHSVFSSL
ncbi:hypothetical protein EBB79_04805 [Parasedimentitalea marina]|uniref:Uncharacterized protein n=1 Tax=Parasedimentitalea marina TaxID=2483033 RepID=A0A3T0MZU6_9RHOB|nr:hypothetical protein [Parasedimentitalea marina]AZV77277.1 hypothetical protein EBB79_04805 [Parasedimentitalea marina]